MDLIDRSKAVRELHEVYDDMQYERVYEDGETLANEVENILASLPQENQWIPCSERLPNREEYLKTNGIFIVTDGNRSYAEWFDKYESKGFGEPTMNGFRIDRCVVAWQPLPEPYKESEKE